jgi:hypothetical protein
MQICEQVSGGWLDTVEEKPPHFTLLRFFIGLRKTHFALSNASESIFGSKRPALLPLL